jgi:hypothetical protein
LSQRSSPTDLVLKVEQLRRDIASRSSDEVPLKELRGANQDVLMGRQMEVDKHVELVADVRSRGARWIDAQGSSPALKSGDRACAR